MKKIIKITLLSFFVVFIFIKCITPSRFSQITTVPMPVPNGGFEETTVIAEGAENWTGRLKANGWTVVPPLSNEHEWSVEIIANEESVQGERSNALKITNNFYNRNDITGNFAVQVYTTIEGISAGMYRIDARIKGDWDESQAGTVQFMVECINKNGDVIFTDYPGQPGVTSEQFKPGELKTIKKNTWDSYQTIRSPRKDHEIYQYFNAPAETIRIKLYCWFLAVGSVWFDNITIAKADLSEKAFFNADKVFLYTDDKKGGVAEVILSRSYVSKYGGVNNFKVDFVLYDGEYYNEAGIRLDTITGAYNEAIIDYEKAVVIKEVKGLNFTGGKTPLANFRFNKDMLPLEKHKYTLIATVWQGNNKLDLFKQNLYVYPRPSIVKADADGNFSHFEMNGEVFNPIILYISANHNPAYAKEAGVNVVQTYNLKYWTSDEHELFNQTKTWLHDYGLKALVNLPVGDIDDPTDSDFTSMIINAWKDDPAVFGFIIADEPFKNATSDRDSLEAVNIYLEERYRFVRDLDDTHPVYIVDYHKFAEDLKYCDMFDHDNYPTVSSTRDITRKVTQAVSAANKIKPILYLTGTYYWSFENWRDSQNPPTTNVIRNTIYRALEANAKGIGYWCFEYALQIGPEFLHPTNIFKTLNETELWEPVKIISHAEIPLLYDLFINGKATILYKSGEGSDETSLFIRQWISQTDGKMYLLAHNRSMNNRRVNISLKNAGGNPIGAYTAKPIGLTTLSKADAVSGTNNINMTLGSEEIVLFEIDYN